MKYLISILIVMAAVSACSPAGDESGVEPATGTELATTETAQSGADKDASALATLLDDIWARRLEHSTYLRLRYGLPVERFEDITLGHYQQDLAAAAEFRKRLTAIDPDRLDEDDRISWEILDFELRDDGANDDDYWLTFDITAYQAPYLFQQVRQALAAAPIDDQSAAQQYLFLVGELADLIDQLIVKVEGQADRGFYLPKPALPPTRATWEGFRSSMPGALRPADDRLAALSAEEREAFLDQLQGLVDTRVTQGFDQLLSAIGERYEDRAPQSVGLSQYPGGREVYERSIRGYTTLDLTPEEIHQRGLAAVAHIAARMESLRIRMKFDGGARAFLDHIRSDPRFIAQSADEVEQRYLDYIARIEPRLDGYFFDLPEAPYAVRRLPPEAEAGMTYGYYKPPTDADPAGYYMYNASDLANRSLVWAGSLIYHELLPGHHFHIATQQENEALHDFRRNYSAGAFTEGWAEYAASLGIEMGLYETPEELYGRYIGEMFLAGRLVVDTGLNAMGWPLEKARDYLAGFAVQSEAEIASETLRYSTSIPGQALSYRLGYEKIWELRKRAEERLGDNFDVQDFHRAVLSDGAKPLGVLDAKVDRYIRSNQP